MQEGHSDDTGAAGRERYIKCGMAEHGYGPHKNHEVAVPMERSLIDMNEEEREAVEFLLKVVEKLSWQIVTEDFDKNEWNEIHDEAAILVREWKKK